MGGGGADAAAIEVEDAALLAAGKDDAPAKGVATLAVDQPGFEQLLETIASASKMTVQVSAGRVAEAQFLDQVRIMQAPLMQVCNGCATWK